MKPKERVALTARVPEDFSRRYELGEEIGKGATSKVFRARQTDLRRDVVAKLIPTASGEKVRARALQEARILASLDHPRVVKLLDFGEGEDMLYFVYPFEQGRSLQDCLPEDAPLPDDAAREVLEDTLEGLAHLHESGVVHRDLKPANLLCLDEGGVKLLDFGLAKLLEEDSGLTATDVFLGTPLYTSPAQVLGDPVEPRDDLYALGLVAYRMLSGRMAVPMGKVDQIFDAHLYHRPRPLRELRPELPPRLAGLVMDLLEKEREDRPPSARAALDALGDQRIPPGPRPATRELVASWTLPLAARAPEPPEAPARDPAESGAPGPPPGSSSGPGARVLGLVALALLAAAALLPRTPARPRDVRFEVVGDALLVRYRGGRGVRLEVGPARLSPEASAEGEGEIVLRGLARDRPTEARLVWEGAGGETREFTAERPAIAGLPVPVTARELRLSVLRPVRVGWEGTPQSWDLDPGAPRIPAPPSGSFPWVLRVEERGVASSRRWSAAEVLPELVERLEASFAGVGARDRHRALVSAGETAATVGGPPRGEVTGALTWLVEGFRALPVTEDAAHRVFRWIQRLRLEEAISGSGGLAEAARRGLGAPLYTEPPGGVLEPGDVVLQGDRHQRTPEDRAWRLVAERSGGTRTIALLQDWRYEDGNHALHFRWPSGSPPGSDAVLEVQVSGLLPSSRIRVRADRSAPDALDAILWAPRPAPTEKPYYTGWVRLVVPARLVPPAGTRMRFLLEPLFEEAVPYVYLDRFRMGWVRPGTSRG